jgi:putative membrane protein insertion efficiency factor
MSASPATLTDESTPAGSARQDSTGTAAGDRPPSHHHGPVARALVALIRGYQLARSGRVTGCRYLPTCSAYAEEAIERFGARCGGWLAVKRLARCHPWGSHGMDPVPDGRASCWPH